MQLEFQLILARIGKNVLRLRKSKNITQEQLALVTLVSPNYICRLEKGSVNPSLRILRKISRKFHVKIRLLFVGI